MRALLCNAVGAGSLESYGNKEIDAATIVGITAAERLYPARPWIMVFLAGYQEGFHNDATVLYADQILFKPTPEVV